MTEQVRKSYRNHRKTMWAGVLVVAIVGALAASVLPATGAPGDNTGLPSDPLGVQPVEDPSGGTTYSCSPGFTELKINNPKSGQSYSTTVSGVPVSVTLTVSGGANRDKYVSFRSNIAAVRVVAVKGGTKNAVYNYSSPAKADGYGSGTTNPLTVDVNGTDNGKIGLHAPVDSSGAPFSVSIMTFCLALPTQGFSCNEDSPMSGTALGGTGGTVTYEAVLVFKGEDCKTGDAVMYTETSAGNKLYATLNPVVPGGDAYQVVEHLVWTGITGNLQNPIDLLYDDVAPYDGLAPSPWRTMLMCVDDPRPDPVDDPFDLGGFTPAMPAGSPAHTTCMLQSTDLAGGGYDAWLYSNVDGGRSS